MTVPPFTYISGNPDNLQGAKAAAMGDIQGPFYDLRAYLNSLGPLIDATSPGQQVLTAAPVLDVGMLNQLRAGRQLALADFTSLGLQAPLGLWNLTDLTDVSGNLRALSNKGNVPFGPGINGVAGTAAVFSGSPAQALYIPDTQQTTDPFRIRTGSWGCWFRTAKRATGQDLVTKYLAAQRGFTLALGTGNVVNSYVSNDATGSAGVALTGVSDVCDDRWHFAVATHDGTALRIYVDGVLEATGNAAFPIFGSSAPLNIGAEGADAGAAAVNPHYGRIDEAFVSADVLSDDQVRLLYCARIAHAYGSTPTRITLNVRRRRRGGTLAVTDFTTQPLRLHNFTAGALTDEGSGGQALTNNGTALSVAGADGAYSPNADPTLRGNAFSFAGAQSLSATDAGLPAGTASRSYGCWFKTATVPGTSGSPLAWGGTVGTQDCRFSVNSAGQLVNANGADAIVGPFVVDGQWHFAAASEDNAAGDGVRRKLYVDGRLVGGSTVLNAITLAGANRFRVGALSDGTSLFTGQIDGAFVTGYAMGQDEILRLWAKGTQALGLSPKNAGDHVEAIDATSLLVTFDSLDSTAQVDVGVAA